MIEIAEGCYRIADYAVNRSGRSWDFAEAQAGAIAAHWAQRRRENPKFFNGRVFVTTAAAIADGILQATVTETDFAAALYWREHGFEGADVADLFAAAVIRCADGALIYGRQALGHVNAGFVYPPSGFLDPADVRADGSIDLAGSAAREAGEETGITDLAREPGILLVRQGPHLCAGFVLRSPLASGEFLERAWALIKAQPDPELDALVALTCKADIGLYPMRDYARMIAELLLER